MEVHDGESEVVALQLEHASALLLGRAGHDRAQGAKVDGEGGGRISSSGGGNGGSSGRSRQCGSCGGGRR